MASFPILRDMRYVEYSYQHHVCGRPLTSAEINWNLGMDE